MKLSHPRRTNAWIGGLIATALLGWTADTRGQGVRHSLFRSDLPPGMVGAIQVANSPGRRGYVQPIEVRVPSDAVVSIGGDGAFQFDATRLRVGLLVGHPYRLRITNIPRHENSELYPSIELIDRLHPPLDQKTRFPIPIEITQDDVEMALRGHLVVRVIYVENPQDAFPRAEDDEQRSFDVLSSEDPLHVADELGRPIAILRLGSRVPTEGELNDDFLFHCPPVEWIADTAEPLSGIDSLQAPAPVITPAETPTPTTSPEAVPNLEKRETLPPTPADPQTDNPFLDDETT